MASSILRATFGRLSITKSSLGRIVVGHIQIEGTILDRRNFHTGGFAGKHKQQAVKLELFYDKYPRIAKKEDEELIELVLAMVEGNLI